MTAPKPPMDEELHRILNEGVRPHSPRLAEIGFSGEVAVVVFEPTEDAKATARAIGWDGASPVFRLSQEGRHVLAGPGSAAETRMAKWLRKKLDPAAPVARILVLTGSGTLLVNYSVFQGWFLEPGADDARGLS